MRVLLCHWESTSSSLRACTYSHVLAEQTQALEKRCLLDDSSYIRPLLNTVMTSIGAHESHTHSQRDSLTLTLLPSGAV